MTENEHTYTEDEVERRLHAELPRWHYSGGWIRRKYKTGGWKGTTMVVGAVAHIAEAAWHHPDLAVSYAFVEVKLQTHSAQGITDKDFELARKIEEFVTWRPEGGALEGTPDDPRFRYVKHDA